MRQRESRGLGPNAASESSSANTANCRARERRDLGGRPVAERRRRVDPRGHQHHRRVAIAGHPEVHRAGDPAVHIASAVDRHRGPRPGHRATGRHRIDEPDTRSPVENDQFAGGDVDRGDPQRPVRPVVRRQALSNHPASDGLGKRFGRQRHGPDPLHLLSGPVQRVVVRLAQGGQKNFDDVVEVDAGIDLGRRLGDLPIEQHLGRAAAADLRGDRGTGRGPHQHVGIQQQPGRGRRLVGDAAQNPCLPGDSGYPAAGQHERASGGHVPRHHTQCCACWTGALRSARRSRCVGGSGSTTPLVICSPALTWTSSPG